MHNFTGTLIGMVHIMLPFLVLPLYASMRAIDRDYLRAAANLGASPTQRVLAGVLSAVAARPRRRRDIVFVLCLGFYVTPALLGGGKRDDVVDADRSDIERLLPTGARRARSASCCWC